MRQTLRAVAMAGVFLWSGPGSAAVTIDYAKTVQASLLFYEAQQAGHLPDWNRVQWRGDATLADGQDVGVDLSGGWYDAGDHVKFGFPMASAATFLAFGGVEYAEAYKKIGQWDELQRNLRFVADYFIKAHPEPELFYGQVGSGGIDHSWWGPVEVIHEVQQASRRPAYALSPQCPGSDLAGETAAALAAISMVFSDDDPEYRDTLLRHARELYDFATSYRGKYSDCIKDAASFYNSWSGYQDELVWGAIWLYRATGEQSYLDLAEKEYDELNLQTGEQVRSYKWTLAWDDKAYGAYVLLAKLTGKEKYHQDAKRWLDYWTKGYQGQKIRYTPGGLAFLDQWGANRYAANTAFLALVYSDVLKASSDPKSQIYYDFARSQMRYLLGDNPKKMPYVIGLAAHGPKNPHHRTAHGSYANQVGVPAESRHLLIGALVGGPDANDQFKDDRGNYITNEVAVDYNALFTGAAARLSLDFGGTPWPDESFPPKETVGEEYFIEARSNASGPRFVEIAAVVHNRSAWPAEVSRSLKLRYFVDLKREKARGYQVEDITVSSGYSQAKEVSGLKKWRGSDDIYYVEVSFAGVAIFPGGQSESKKEVQFRLNLPYTDQTPGWDNQDDPSWDNYDSTLRKAPKMALYHEGELVFGGEP